MTTFQLMCVLLFVAVVGLAYRKEIFAKLFGRSIDVKSPSIAVTIVNELIAVTELRDKLAAENCQEGVDACTALLRVIVEHTKTKKTG